MRSLFRAPALAAALLAAGFGAASAQQGPAAPAATPPASPGPTAAAPAGPPPVLSVLVIDVSALLQNSKAAKMVRSQMEEKQAEYRREIQRQEEQLRQQRDELQRQQASLSREAMEQKGREFQQRVGELDRNVQGKRQALERSNNDALEKIQEAMLKIIADIAKQRKVNLVFQRTEVVLFDPAFDITDEVLRRLDEDLPSLTVSFVTPTPPAAATPASPAQPQPTAGNRPRRR